MQKKEVIRAGRTTDIRLSPYDKASQEFNDALWLAIEKYADVREAERLAKSRLAKKLAKATVKINKNNRTTCA